MKTVFHIYRVVFFVITLCVLSFGNSARGALPNKIRCKIRASYFCDSNGECSNIGVLIKRGRPYFAQVNFDKGIMIINSGGVITRNKLNNLRVNAKPNLVYDWKLRLKSGSVWEDYLFRSKPGFQLEAHFFSKPEFGKADDTPLDGNFVIYECR